MKDKRYILALGCWLLAISLIGCGTKKKAVREQVAEIIEPEVPAWHTCLIQGARAKIQTNTETFSAAVTMQTVHDSMLVISIMPAFGLEAMRLEATPLELTAFDKLHGQYAKATFAELNRKLTPNLNWDILQQICSAELPTGSEKARLQYLFGDETIQLVIDYVPRQIDVPVKVYNQPTARYQQVDISKWL